MAIYEGSRYTKTELYNRDGLMTFKTRLRENFFLEGATIHEFTEGETLGGLADKYYGDSQLWWVILEVNSQYRLGIDIPYGSELIIPTYEEVVVRFGED